MDKFDLLCNLQAISNFAYDIHYTAKGRNFYSDHIFSERLADVDVMDDFIETFYLGESEDAPDSSKISSHVAEITPKPVNDTQMNFKALREMIVKVLIAIQNYKGTKGEEDLLGSVAHILQRHNGLLFRELVYTPEEIRNSDEEWENLVTAKETMGGELNNEKWITVHPNKENPDDYRRLKVEDGETSKEAVERKYGKDKKDKEPEKEEKKETENKPIGIDDLQDIIADEDKLNKLAGELFDDDAKRANITPELRKELYSLLHSNAPLTAAEWKDKVKKKLKKLAGEKKEPEKEDKEEKSEKSLHDMTDEELTKMEDDTEEEVSKYFADKEKAKEENKKIKELKEYIEATRKKYWEVDYASPEGERLRREINRAEEAYRQAHSDFEDEYNKEHNKEYMAIAKKLNEIRQERYERENQKELVSLRKEERLKEKIDNFMTKSGDLSDEEYEKQYNDIKQEIKDTEGLVDWHRQSLLDSLSTRSEVQRFDRKVSNMKKNIENYKKTSDKVIAKLWGIELPSEKFEKEDEARKKGLKELTVKQAEAQTEEEKKEISQKINEFILDNWRANNQRNKIIEANAFTISDALKDSLGDTGREVITVKASKGSANNIHYENIAKALSGVIGKNTNVGNPPKIVGRKGRAHFRPSENTIKLEKEDSVGTAIHEYVHFLENNNPKIIENSRAFLEYRTKGEKTDYLRNLTDIKYGYDERGKADKFFNAYCGKMYSRSDNYRDAYATEVMSMGVQRLFEDAKKFALEDREYFDFVIANLRGEL